MRQTRYSWKPGAGLLRVVTLLLLPMMSGTVVAGELTDADGALAWRFQQGQALRYRIRHSVTTAVVTGAGLEETEPPAPVLDAILAWSVEKVDTQGLAEIRQTLERVREEMTERSPGGDRMVYDSGDPRSVDNPWSAMKQALYRPLIGAPYRLKVDRRGSIVDLKMPEDALKRWQEFRIQPRDDRDPLFTREGMRSLLAAVPELPGRPIGRGETWSHRHEATQGVLRTTSVETFSLIGQEGPSVTFAGRPEIIMRVIPNPARAGAEPVPAEKTHPLVDAMLGKQSGESKLTFDLAKGRLVRFSRRHRYDVTYAYEAEAGTGTARTVKLTTAMEFDLTLIAAPNGP